MRKNQSGFTLLEIMLVVTIIALLMAAAIYKMGPGNIAYARHVKIAGDIQNISTQLKLYESMNGFYPTTEQGLEALVVQPSTDPQPQRWYQLFTDLPKDPWQRNYIYANPGRKNPSGFDLYSAGQDGKPDTADDDWGGQ
jgi:general secretion pathway protein G